jgi:hypothetical protein
MVGGEIKDHATKKKPIDRVKSSCTVEHFTLYGFTLILRNSMKMF